MIDEEPVNNPRVVKLVQGLGELWRLGVHVVKRRRSTHRLGHKLVESRVIQADRVVKPAKGGFGRWRCWFRGASQELSAFGDQNLQAADCSIVVVVVAVAVSSFRVARNLRRNTGPCLAQSSLLKAVLPLSLTLRTAAYDRQLA